MGWVCEKGEGRWEAGGGCTHLVLPVSLLPVFAELVNEEAATELCLHDPSCPVNLEFCGKNCKKKLHQALLCDGAGKPQNN